MKTLPFSTATIVKMSIAPQYGVCINLGETTLHDSYQAAYDYVTSNAPQDTQVFHCVFGRTYDAEWFVNATLPSQRGEPLFAKRPTA